jgi:diamine N-acetyltransferase
MITLQSENIYLRALEPEDLSFIYEIENDENIWEVSNTQTPYSQFLIKQYLENANQDIYEAKQLRLVICLNKDFKAIGLIDLFDYDPRNNRAGIGIIIKDDFNKNYGFGSQALELVIKYSFQKLNLNQLFANINAENIASVRLFTKFGFQKIGTKKQWNLINGKYQDEDFFQLIKNDVSDN